MSDFKIEKNVPFIKGRGHQIYPFGAMEVGDSFAVPDELYKKITSAAYFYGKKHNKKYSVSIKQLRCWRIA